MSIRLRVFLQMLGTVVAIVGTIVALDFFFPDYGLMIYWTGFCLYLLYCLYEFKVKLLERERDRIVNILKE